MKRPKVTYVVTPIHDKFISRFLYTLYKYSEPDSFRVVVIDQCKDGFSKPVMDYVRPLIHLYMHPIRNLGYAKAQNEGIIHGLHWETPYICAANDDIEFLNSRWMDGIYETFAKHDNIGAVVPMSPKVAGWGYGVKDFPEVVPYKESITEEDYDYLLKGDFTDKADILPKTMPKKIGGTIVDGAVFVMPYFKREVLQDVGLMDEHFFPGSGEDMDWNARAYIKNYRVVSTSLSWVWHHWSKSKDLFASGDLEHPYYKPASHAYWNNMGDIWRPQDNDGHEFEVWGAYTTPKGLKRKMIRVPEIFVDNI